ncbi:unnamed protein product [Bursaphelenchus okinawaensis]|uniref:Uncharacterized protein n=1 Tax=Bursaphelenchus okinawaensis TaxID=465554 RepID=A0A811KY14_9BILA|nr:unnamed protein product [Bursaphelenchus okinawaensis]CAG9113551.1 unnamed protein product [Bursaphelenchus okinawaensis]
MAQNEEKTSDMAKRMFNSMKKRKMVEKAEDTPSTSEETNSNDMSEESEANSEKLRKKAREALLRESARGKERAERMGSQGWVKPKSLNTNKVFLSRVLQSTLSSGKIHKHKKKRELKDK